MERRRFLLGGTLIMTRVPSVYADTDFELPPAPSWYVPNDPWKTDRNQEAFYWKRSGKSPPPTNPMGSSGVVRPDDLDDTDKNWIRAVTLSSNATGVGRETGSAIKVMEYVRSFRGTGIGGESFSTEWSTKKNPFLYMLFYDLAMQPSNDRVPWCAALLNWCLKKSRHRTSASASALSFLAVGSETKAPEYGDIVVFRTSKDTGHVGFFAPETSMGDQTRPTVRVLGGNQTVRQEDGKPSSVRGITYSQIPKDAPGYKLERYIAASSLRM
jgi:uncharacterized protein (TIGR02594 family)